MRIQKVSNSTSARQGQGHVPPSLSTECDKLRNDIKQLNEELDYHIEKNEKLEAELEEARGALATALERMKTERKISEAQVKCVDCKDVIEEPLCQACLGGCQDESGSEDIIVIDGDD
jgi:hypothetical protein